MGLLAAGDVKFLGCVASLNIKKLYFSYKYFCIFVRRIVDVFSQSDVTGNVVKKAALRQHYKLQI
jgi:hypothetical protein